MLCWFGLHVLFLIGIVNLGESSGKVRLTDVSTLTLYRDKYTTGRRSSPVPQIQCIGGSAKGKFEPRVVQCYNRGYDGDDVQWECKAEMSDQYEFGEIRISCEGYEYANDPYILRGSCGLKYKLEYSREGGSNYGESKKTPSAPPYEDDHEFGLTFPTIVILLLFFFLVYYSCSQPTTGDERTRRSGWGWDQGPPPPPSGGNPPPGFKTFTRPTGAPPTYEQSFYDASSAPSQSSGPGFFSGLGLGGLAGYMYGRSQNSDSNSFRGRRQYDQDGCWSSSHNRHRENSPRPSTSRTASAFGGTERR
ncbi:unnamed protein product [Litomosoides sigmodontis]|uniref:Store-operated calcium entry-associated regulatory factor n=1 Tax=Litomosoides sigmodontis TaxID=42156 RepID=A0A3P6TFM7_LITSI|nr:unnamed protein product [Litomosoides sigmodontis]